MRSYTQPDISLTMIGDTEAISLTMIGDTEAVANYARWLGYRNRSQI
jgi:hypothetical protein